MSRPAGHYVTSTITGKAVRAFIPDPLPPDPEIALTPAEYELMILSTMISPRLR